MSDGTRRQPVELCDTCCDLAVATVNDVPMCLACGERTLKVFESNKPNPKPWYKIRPEDEEEV